MISFSPSPFSGGHFLPQVIEEYIQFALSYMEAQPPFLGFGCDAASGATTSYTPDPYAVSSVEARSYYAGLPSEPTLLYRTGKEQQPSPASLEGAV